MFKGQSKYNVVRCFVDALAEGLENNDCQVEVLDLLMDNEQDVIKRLVNIQQDKPDVVISFNGIGREGINSYPELPYIGWLVDHPIIHHPRLIEWGEKDYAVCIDGSHKELIDKHYPNIGGTYFIPHAGIEGTEKKPFGERSIDVLFSGSYTSSDGYLKELQKELQPYEQKIAFILINMMQEHNLTLEQALEIFLVESDIPFNDEEFTNLCLRYLYVDYFMRAFYREELLRTLTDNGIVVDIFGDKWEEFECNNKDYLRLHEPLDFMENVKMMGDAKISLNSIPSFKAGGHERIFSAMLNGALCVTDSNAWLDEEFKDGENIICYSNNNMQQVASAIIYYLEDEEESARITENAYQIAKAKHTWDVRAKELLNVIDGWKK